MEFKFKRTIEHYFDADGILKMVGHYPFKDLGIGEAVELSGKYLQISSVRGAAFMWAKNHGMKFTTNVSGIKRVIVTRIS